MGMFNSMRKPRGFNHQYIYVDERKEKLAKMDDFLQLRQRFLLKRRSRL